MYAMNFRAAWSSAAVLILAGCASLQVRTDYDQGALFTSLSTYDWVGGEVDAGSNPAVNSPLLGKHIRGAVEGELDRRGYRKTSGTPDFRIAYRVVAQERARAVGSYGYGSPYGYGRSYYPGRFGLRFFGGRHFSPYGYGGYSGAGYGYGGAGGVREYLRSTLVLDITDFGTGELIWRGWARKSLDLDPRPEKVRMYVDEAVAEMLADFPPEP